jgi:hypothetical protein
MLLTSSYIWMDTNSSKNFSNTVWCFELFLFSTFFWSWLRYLSPAVIRGHLPLLSPRAPSNWLSRAFIVFICLCYPSPFVFLAFLILGSPYPGWLSAPEENAGFNRQDCDHFSAIFRVSKNSTFLWATIWLLPSVFNYWESLALCSVIIITI